MLDIPTDNLHHAYILQGERERIFESLEAFLENEVGVAVSANPDYFVAKTDTLGIDTARKLRRRQEKKAFSGTRKIFVISCDEITLEAQNSLLKSVEEPTEGTHFFLILGSIENILPTLLSRVEVVKAGKKESDAGNISPKQFIAASKPERLEMVSGMVSDNDSRAARQFLDALEYYIHDTYRLEKSEQVYKEIDNAKKYLGNRGSSLKTLLHHVALSVPPVDALE